jgi:hypothetical protein
LADPVASPETPDAGAVPAAPTTYVGFMRTWASPAPAPVADKLDITATNIATMTVNPARARVDCNAVLNVTTDGPFTVTLAGCGSTTFAVGRSIKRSGRDS